MYNSQTVSLPSSPRGSSSIGRESSANEASRNDVNAAEVAAHEPLRGSARGSREEPSTARTVRLADPPTTPPAGQGKGAASCVLYTPLEFKVDESKRKRPRKIVTSRKVEHRVRQTPPLPLHPPSSVRDLPPGGSTFPLARAPLRPESVEGLDCEQSPTSSSTATTPRRAVSMLPPPAVVAPLSMATVRTVVEKRRPDGDSSPRGPATSPAAAVSAHNGGGSLTVKKTTVKPLPFLEQKGPSTSSLVTPDTQSAAEKVRKPVEPRRFTGAAGPSRDAVPSTPRALSSADATSGTVDAWPPGSARRIASLTPALLSERRNSLTSVSESTGVMGTGPRSGRGPVVLSRPMPSSVTPTSKSSPLCGDGPTADGVPTTFAFAAFPVSRRQPTVLHSGRRPAPATSSGTEDGEGWVCAEDGAGAPKSGRALPSSHPQSPAAHATWRSTSTVTGPNSDSNLPSPASAGGSTHLHASTYTRHNGNASWQPATTTTTLTGRSSSSTFLQQGLLSVLSAAAADDDDNGAMGAEMEGPITAQKFCSLQEQEILRELSTQDSGALFSPANSAGDAGCEWFGVQRDAVAEMIFGSPRVGGGDGSGRSQNALRRSLLSCHDGQDGDDASQGVEAAAYSAAFMDRGSLCSFGAEHYTLGSGRSPTRVLRPPSNNSGVFPAASTPASQQALLRSFGSASSASLLGGSVASPATIALLQLAPVVPDFPDVNGDDEKSRRLHRNCLYDDVLETSTVHEERPMPTQMSEECLNTFYCVLNQKYVIYHYELGHGSYSHVHLCYCIADDVFYAVKILDRHRLQRRGISHERATFLINNEISIMKQLRHRNIAALHEVIRCPQGRKVYLIMELAERGEVMTVNGDGTIVPFDDGLKSFPEDATSRVTKAALQGLLYTHHFGIAHRDVKPSNILLTTEGVVKLSDFGVSFVVDDFNPTRVPREGSVAFLAPELLVTPEVDVNPNTPTHSSTYSNGNAATPALGSVNTYNNTTGTSGSAGMGGTWTSEEGSHDEGAPTTGRSPPLTPSVDDYAGWLQDCSRFVDLFKADVFSLGVTTFALLTGRLPWSATSARSQLEAVLACPDPFLPYYRAAYGADYATPAWTAETTPRSGVWSRGGSRRPSLMRQHLQQRVAEWRGSRSGRVVAAAGGATSNTASLSREPHTRLMGAIGTQAVQVACGSPCANSDDGVSASKQGSTTAGEFSSIDRLGATDLSNGAGNANSSDGTTEAADGHRVAAGGVGGLGSSLGSPSSSLGVQVLSHSTQKSDSTAGETTGLSERPTHRDGSSGLTNSDGGLLPVERDRVSPRNFSYHRTNSSGSNGRRATLVQRVRPGTSSMLASPRGQIPFYTDPAAAAAAKLQTGLDYDLSDDPENDAAVAVVPLTAKAVTAASDSIVMSLDASSSTHSSNGSRARRQAKEDMARRNGSRTAAPNETRQASSHEEQTSARRAADCTSSGGVDEVKAAAAAAALLIEAARVAPHAASLDSSEQSCSGDSATSAQLFINEIIRDKHIRPYMVKETAGLPAVEGEHGPISADAVDFVRCCLCIDSAQRRTVYELYRHPWILNLTGSLMKPQRVQHASTNPSIALEVDLDADADGDNFSDGWLDDGGEIVAEEEIAETALVDNDEDDPDFVPAALQNPPLPTAMLDTWRSPPGGVGESLSVMSTPGTATTAKPSPVAALAAGPPADGDAVADAGRSRHGPSAPSTTDDDSAMAAHTGGQAYVSPLSSLSLLSALTMQSTPRSLATRATRPPRLPQQHNHGHAKERASSQCRSPPTLSSSIADSSSHRRELTTIATPRTLDLMDQSSTEIFAASLTGSATASMTVPTAADTGTSATRREESTALGAAGTTIGDLTVSLSGSRSSGMPSASSLALSLTTSASVPRQRSVTVQNVQPVLASERSGASCVPTPERAGSQKPLVARGRYSRNNSERNVEEEEEDGGRGFHFSPSTKGLSSPLRQFLESQRTSAFAGENSDDEKEPSDTRSLPNERAA